VHVHGVRQPFSERNGLYFGLEILKSHGRRTQTYGMDAVQAVPGKIYRGAAAKPRSNCGLPRWHRDHILG
jgi:hypothetical protein